MVDRDWDQKNGRAVDAIRGARSERHCFGTCQRGHLSLDSWRSSFGELSQTGRDSWRRERHDALDYRSKKTAVGEELCGAPFLSETGLAELEQIGGVDEIDEGVADMRKTPS